MKKILFFVLFIATVIPCHAGNFYETGNLELGISHLSPSGKYKKYWNEAKDEFGNNSLSGMAIRFSAGFPMAEKTTLGLDLTYFGENKADGNKTGYSESEKETVMGVSIILKYSLYTSHFSNGKSIEYYAKVGIGEYRRSYEYDMMDDYLGRHNGEISKSGLGYNAAIGANLMFSKNFSMGLEYRIDKFSEKLNATNSGLDIEVPGFEASSLGLNLTYRFGNERNPAEEQKQTVEQTATVAENSTDTIVAETAVPAEEAKTVVQSTVPVAEVNEKGILKAVNPKPGPITQLDKDTYIAETDKLLNNLPESGKLEIPSMGVLFKIGQSELLPYYNEMINKFLDLYFETDGTSKILVEAYSSNANNETAKNPQLSRQRAMAVVNYIIKNDIPASLIEIKAYGNKKIESGIFNGDKNCKGGQCFRRVNISIK